MTPPEVQVRLEVLGPLRVVRSDGTDPTLWNDDVVAPFVVGR